MDADMEASMFSMISMFNMNVRACVHTCACVCMYVCMGHPPHIKNIPIPTSIHPFVTPPRGWTPEISKNLITLELIKIFQFRLEDFKSVTNSPPMGGCMVWWVGGCLGGWVGWVGSGQNTKNLKNVD